MLSASMSTPYLLFTFARNLKLNSFYISIDAKRLTDVTKEIEAFGGDVLAVAGDVGADDFPKKIVDATVQCVFLLCWTIFESPY